MTDWLHFEQLGATEIMQVLPHRYPFLFIDRVLSVKTGKPIRVGMPEKELADARRGTIARAVKNVTINEMPFMGHFPGNPIFPGVLTLETMAQAGAFCTVPYVAALHGGKLPPLQVALASFDSVRFRKPILPGDRMDITIEVKQCRGEMWSLEGLVEVDGKRAAEGMFMAVLQAGGAK